MKSMLKIWLVILIGAAVGVLIKQDSGYILLAAGTYSIEMSLTLFVLMLGLVFVALYLLIRLWVHTYRLPSTIHHWHQQRRANRAQTAMTRGLLDMSEGHWQTAEKRLMQHAPNSETALLNYLAAARAAQQQGAQDRRDSYIQLAHAEMPSANIAVSLTQAELQIADHQLEQALATLQHLHEVAPKHVYVLRLLRDLYEQLEDWEHLLGLIPALRRRKVESATALDKLEQTTRQAILKQAALRNTTNQLTEAWAAQPRAWQQNIVLLHDYIGYVQAQNNHAEAETLLYNACRQRWQPELLALYGQLDSPQPGKHLKQLETYLPAHSTDPDLLLALGRLSLRAKLWGKARDYLETCVGQPQPPLDAYRELGRLLEHMGERDTALQHYRRALLTHKNPISLPDDIGQTAMLALQQPATQKSASHGASHA